MMVLLLSVSACLSVLLLSATRVASLEKRGLIFAFLSWVVDVCPLLLLLCSMAFFSAYHPFAQTYRSFLSSPQGDFDFEQITEATLVAHFGPFLWSPQWRFQLWLGITSVLALLATFLLVRMAMRRHAANVANS
jgi:cobalamin synthase